MVISSFFATKAPSHQKTQNANNKNVFFVSASWRINVFESLRVYGIKKRHLVFIIMSLLRKVRFCHSEWMPMAQITKTPNPPERFIQAGFTKINLLIVKLWCILVTWSFGGIFHFSYFRRGVNYQFTNRLKVTIIN
jgi:hypothetical protein